MIKDIFFKDDEAVIEIHPPNNKYVNNMPNCLHLWRCTYKEMVLPPSCLVGVREGQTREDDVCPIKFEIIVKGKCVVCGKDLTEDRIFICKECSKKAESEVSK